MKTFGSHRGGGAKSRSKMTFGAEGVSRAMVTLLTPAPKVLVYPTLERLSLCNSSLSTALLLAVLLPAVLLPLFPMWDVLYGMSSAGVLIVLAGRCAFYHIRIAASCPCHPSLSHSFLQTDIQTAQAHQNAYHTPTYDARLPHPLTKTNYHHTQWLSATLPHTFVRATSALSHRTLSRATPKTPRHAATRTLLAVVTIGPVEFRATPSTSTTDRLIGQLHGPARPKVRDDPRPSHSCSPLPHTAKPHAKMTFRSARPRQHMIKSSVLIASTSFDMCLAAHVSLTLPPTPSTKPSLLPWASTLGILQHAAAPHRHAPRSSKEI